MICICDIKLLRFWDSESTPKSHTPHNVYFDLDFFELLFGSWLSLYVCVDFGEL